MPDAGAKVHGKKHAKAHAKANIRAPEKKPGSYTWVYIAATAVALYLVFQVYAPALGGPYIFDDMFQPYHLPDFPRALSAWIHGVRPLLMLSYWLNYQVSQEPPGFHITNVLIHLVNAFLVFFIVRKMERFGPAPASEPSWLAAFAAAVFLLHPIQTESVAYIAGRSEALSVMFFLAAFTVFLYRRSPAVSWGTAVAVLLLFGAAVASKEHTLVLPALLLVTDYYWNPGFSFSGIRRNWRLYLPIAAGGAAGAVFVARMLAHAGSAGFGLKEFTWYQYFFTQCRAFFVYLRLFVFPIGQNLDWNYPISRNILDHGALLGLLAILLLIGAAISYRRRYPLASYGFLIYVLLMAPTSSFVPIKDAIAERRLYLPMIGLLLVLTAELQMIRVDRRKLAWVFCAILAVLAFLTWQRNQVWASEIALWEDAAQKAPTNSRAHFQLAHAYYIQQHYPEAVAQYAETARLQTPTYNLLYDWGLALNEGGQPAEGLAKLKAAAALEATAQVYAQISMVYARQKQWPEALAALAQAEKIDHNYDMIYDNRGGIRANTGDLAGAVSDYQHALELNPQNDHARQMLEIVRRQQPASTPR